MFIYEKLRHLHTTMAVQYIYHCFVALQLCRIMLAWHIKNRRYGIVLQYCTEILLK